MRKKILAANWKMNGDLANLECLLEIFKELKFGDNLPDNKHLVFFPSFVYLHNIAATLSGTSMELGAQDVSTAAEGAYTGQISASMLAEFNVEYVLIGHSERRQYCHEDNSQLVEKLKQALAMGITPILCVGESQEQYKSGETKQVLAEQLSQILDYLANQDLHKLVLAYEPVWAIGTGLAATAEQANRVHQDCREIIQHYDAKLAQELPIIYGGSVNANNADTFFRMSDIDGALVGGASLDAKAFINIYDHFN